MTSPRLWPRAGWTVLLIVLLTYGMALAPVPGSRRVTRGDLQPVVSVRASQGYWLVAADGGTFDFGDARFLGAHRNQSTDIVGMARTPDGTGLWTVDDDGDVLHYGTAINYGSRLVDTNDIRGFAARPGGDGYWMVSKTGAVYAFGAAGFHGPSVPLDLNQLIVGMAATPSGNGYWHVARDGGIFSYGDARFFGSTGAIRLNQPIVGMAATPSGQGYWLVASDGGIFSFGDAVFYGSTGAVVLNQPIVAMAPTGTGKGYWLVASDGGVFSFGDASFHGSTGAIVLNQPIIGMVPTRVQLGNDFPHAVADSVAVDEDTSVSVNVLANDLGLSDGGVTVSVLEGPGHGSATVAADGRIVYTPAANYFGPDSLTYVVADADGDRSFATVSISVNSRNDAPVAPNQPLFTPEETLAAGSVLATDADGDPLTYSITGAPAHGTATVNAAGIFTYTPAVNYNGNDTFTITVSDGRGGTGTATIGMSVGSANDPPVAADQSLSTGEDTALNGSVIATDADGDSLTYSVTAVPAHGTAFVNALSLFTYTPALNYTGADAFTITVNDGHGGTDTATINVSVLGANDPPTITAIAPQTTSEDVPVTPSPGFTVGDPETLAGSLVVTGVSSNQAVVANSGVTFGGSGADRTVVVTPLPNASGQTTVTVTVSDGGLTASTSFLVTVIAVDDPPTISAIDPLDILVGTNTGLIAFTVDDVDTPAGNLVVTATSDNTVLVPDDSAHLVLGGVGSDRTLLVIPEPLETGSATIMVTVFDGTDTVSETFLLTVTAA